jgi:hypothetical protein
MARLLIAFIVSLVVPGLIGPVRAADAKDAKAILEKAIKALGGEEKLDKVKAVAWKGKGTITIMGNESDIATETTLQGLDHIRQEFEFEFGGNKIKGVTVLAGNKGWRKFGDNKMEMDTDAIANESRSVYLTLVPLTILPLQGNGFKTEAIGDEDVGGKQAAGVKVTAPDRKDFRLYFDKESGLPLKTVAKIADFMGNELTQETSFSDYKELGGIKKATKVRSKRDGEKFLELQITEFKVLDRVDPKTFAEPQ